MTSTCKEQAATIVTALLQRDAESLCQLRPLDLPVMGNGSVVWGASDQDAGEMVEYPQNWTGLAARYEDGKTSYWFLGRCQQSGEREFYCLGMASTVDELIDRAKAAVERGIAYWSAATGRSQNLIA